MKKLAIVVFSFLLVGITTKANNDASGDVVINRYDGKTYIFEEGGVEFSVFADGQFDFAYVGPNYGSEVQVNVNTPNVNISFNSGHDYEMFVQYDDYGAVIQVENIPIYYDGYGRITQAGEVDIHYNNRRIVRVGGLYVNYDNYGYYSGCTGYINVYNRFYVARPWHVFYTRPLYSSCVVYDYPYRSYYSPVRYSYSHHRNYYRKGHHKGYKNARRDFYRPGSRVHYKNGRTAANKDYRANRRNTMVSDRGRGNTSNRVAKNGDRGNRGTVNKGKPISNRGDAKRGGRNGSVNKGRPISSRGDAKRGDRNGSVNKGRPVSSRGDAKKGNRNGSVNKGRSTNNRGTAKRGDRNGSVNQGRPVTKRGDSKKVNRETRPQNKTSRVAQNNGNRKVNRSTTSRPSNNKVAKRSSTSRSNTSGKRGGNSKSRSTSKRGRGL